jgi:hypothetical protein
LTVSWADKVGPGRLNAKLSYTYLKTLWNIPLPGQPKDESAGEVESPRNKAVLNLAYKWGNFGINTTTSYTGRVTLDDQFLEYLRQSGTGENRFVHHHRLPADLRREEELPSVLRYG